MTNSNTDNSRKHSYTCLLYPDCENHLLVLDNLLNDNYSMDYATICHNLDIDKDGNYKKPHYHVVFHFENATTKSALAKNLGIEENYIQPCKNYQKALKYLIHYDNLEKHQYNVDCVYGPLKNKVVELTSKPNATTLNRILLDYVRNSQTNITWFEFLDYALQFGCISQLKSMFGYWKEIITEHNLSL